MTDPTAHAVPVVVTGMGVVTALGNDLDTFFGALLAEHTGAARYERFVAEGLRHAHAAMVDRGRVLAQLSAEERELPWATAMAVGAARSALADAGLAAELADRPLVMSCSIGSPAALERPGKSWRELDPSEPAALSRYPQGAIVARTAAALGARGPVMCLTTTCAAGNYAIGAALDLLRDGRAEVALAGGVEELSTIPYTAFHQLRALADVCRPFDESRRGLLFGEGAAFLVLETLSHARARGARAYAQVLAVGYANDAHHLVAPDPEGRGAALAIRRALAEAGLAPEEVGYVNAHGTGTELNDAAEAKALCEVFGARAALLPVSSTKGATGHAMAAATAIEAVVTVLALTRGELPPTTGLQTPDPAFALDLIRRAPRKQRVAAALSSGFGFGGNNAVLAVAQVDHAVASVPARDVFVQSGAACVGSRLGVRALMDKLGEAHTPTVSEVADLDFGALLGKKGLRHVDRSALLLAATLDHELADWPGVDPTRAGAVIGAAYPAYTSVVAVLRDFQRGGATQVNPMLVPAGTANCAPSWWLLRRGITGCNAALGSAQCAGLDAILFAAMQVRRGRVDTVVAGGVEAHTPELWTGLRNLRAWPYPFAEAAAAVLVSAEPGSARLEASVSLFDAGDAQRAQARAIEALGGAGGFDVVVSTHAAVGLHAPRVIAVDALCGETLGAGGALAAVMAARLIEQGDATRVLVVATSFEGYASAAALAASPKR